MQPKLTIQERLKDLRVERSLTLEQLSAETGISKSALGKYEADDFKDISPFSMVELAKFYGVSTDYLLGLTEQKNHPNTELDALHLGDDAIEVLRTGKFNHRLLSELICHKDFQRFMLDAEIYDVVPDKAVLVVDGRKLDEKAFTLNADEWAALPGTVLPYSGSIESAGITHDNGILKNAVSVDLKNVNFESSVQVKLYSGDTLLTTATLQGVTPGSYGFLTCCIATETADEYWSLTPWTPKDNIVPNKAVLFVDGHEQDTKTFTLDADEWAALPGTAFPYSGSIGGGYTYYTIKATAGVNGSISPTGNVSVREGRDQTFTITPDKGYAVANVKIDGKSIGAVKSYTFENVSRTHTIEVIFMKANGNPQTGVFVDVATGSYYEDAVDWAVENGITKGTDDTHFSPDGICTRAQAVTFLWRTAGSPASKTSTMPFTDVPVGSYYYDAVLWAVENGITKGTSDTTFSPNMTCSRAQIVTFLWRSEKSPAAGTANPFADVKSTAYYAGAVLWAVKENITKGTTNTTFSPNADCTRAQIVTFLWRCKK